MSFRNKFKNLIYLGLNCIFGLFSVRKATILMYHSIGHNKVFFTVSPENFIKQMDYLYRKKYNVIFLSELVDFLKSKKEIPSKTVVLTFDDGYEDIFFGAFPIFKKYNFPATVFLTAGFIGKQITNSAGISLKALSFEQIREMHDSELVDFEPHTVNHPRLSRISLEKAAGEILDSREIVGKNLNKKCDLFAYPYGDYNREIQEVLEKNGFSGAITIREGLVSRNDDLLGLKRNSIDSSVGFSQFKGKLNLSVDIFNFIRRK